MVALSNTKIYYKVGDFKTGDYSKEYVFHVPPAQVKIRSDPFVDETLLAVGSCAYINDCLKHSQGTQPATRGTRVILLDDVGRGTMDDAFTWYEYGRPGTFKFT